MIHEFWDVRSNNMLAAYDTRQAALDAIRDVVREGGPIALEWVMLLEDDPAQENKVLLGVGSELLTYVRDAA